MSFPQPPHRPRILIVTPEITALPLEMGEGSNAIRAKAGGLADATASLVAGLVRRGADVHVALPNYRRLFQRRGDRGDLTRGSRIHLADDAIFHHQDRVYRDDPDEALYAALAFQREVVHHIIPRVQPDLIHCNDWMTSLIPAVAKSRGIRSLFTLHNIHGREVTLGRMEETGFGPGEFWSHLYFNRPPGSYDEARWSVPVQMLASGIFAADHVNTVSPGFLQELADGHHSGCAASLRREIHHKQAAGWASGVLNAPDPSFNPALDPDLERPFSLRDLAAGKAHNKRALQRELGLEEDPDAALFFWPSRLDPVQKGPELLSDILHRTVSDYWDRRLQIVAVADGPYQHCLRQITDHFSLHRRVAIRDFNERLARRAYAGADFMLMPSRFEPCGLPQMIAPLYGCLPVVHATGGLRDTVRPLAVERSTGNGFRFEDADSNGLRWAIDQAMAFHELPAAMREKERQRIMRESRREFDPAHFTRNYVELYEKLLGRSLFPETLANRAVHLATLPDAATANPVQLPLRRSRPAA